MADNSIPVDEKGDVLIRSAEFFKAVAGQRQYTNFLDSNHSLPEIWEELGKEENIKALADAGVKHLFLEQKRYKQNEIDDYYQGKVSENALYAKASVFASGHNFGDDEIRQGIAAVDMIVHSKKYGIQIHFADPDSKVVTEDIKKLLKRDHPIYKSDPEAAETLNTLNSIDDIREQLKYNASLSPDMQRRIDNLSDKIGQARHEERFTMNEELAEFIKRKADSDKAVILYGAGHSDQLQDLNEYPGKENVTSVMLLTSRRQEKLSDKPIRDIPDNTYFIDEGRATQKQTVCEDAAKVGTQLAKRGVQICESTLDMGVYHQGPIKEEVQIKR